MKTQFLFAAVMLLSVDLAALMRNNAASSQAGASENTSSPLPTSDRELIENLILQFMRAGDESDTETLSTLLHPEFHVIVNQGVLGSPTLRIVDRTTYLQQIAARHWGGVDRTVNIISVSVSNSVAAVEVRTSSTRSDMTSFLHLVKDAEGNWQLVVDTPFPTPKSAQ